MTIDAVKEETELEEDQINDLVEELFDAQEDESESDEEELPWQLDGSQVDTLTIKWVTSDDTENDDPALLYLKPSGNELTSARLQINYALSGEHNYEPGDVTITIPASMFKTRDGKKTGTITIPYPEDPSTKGDFNWKLVGDNYVLTNTKKMSAATKGYMQIEVGGLTPNQIADMAVSDPFAAKIEVVTWKGNLIGKSSNELTAQLDTEARIVGVDKGVTSAQRLAAEFIPEEYRVEGEAEYVVVDWWIRASINSNTKYTFEFTDMLPDEYHGFIIDAKQDSLQTYEYTSEPLLGNGPSWTTYYRVRSAYPSSQFEKDHTYTFHNNVEARVIEYDPEIEGNPNVQDSDPKLVTKANDSAEIPFLFRDPEWIDPKGHLYMNKNGNDDKPKNNLTHSGISTYRDEHLGSSGYYGIYPSALNRIEEGEDIRLSYTINSRAFLMPFTYEGDATETELMKISNYFKHYLTLTTTDSGIRIGDSKEKLKVFEDFTYDSVEILEPWLYEGEPKNINVEDGTFIVMTAADGTYKYTRTSDLSKCPDITLEILQNGVWKNWVSVSYKTGTRIVTYADGHSDGKMVIDLPEGTENFRTIVVSNNAGINYDVRPVITLKNTEALYKLTDRLFEKSNNPDLDVYNTASFDVVKDTEGKIFEMESAGRDSLRGYTTDTLAIPRKSARQVLVDYDNGRVRIRYDANVSEESLIPDLDSYKEAIESGRLMHETHGTWRDLLPKGVVPIMNSIRLRNGDSITDAYTIENYKGSGRTLLVVEADLTVSPKTYRSGDSYYYMDQPTITFDCWYDFESIKDYGDRLHNVISFESSNGEIGTIEHYTGEPDDPTLNPTNNYSTPLAFENEEEKRYMTDLNPKSDDPAFLYAGVPLRIDVLYRARTSLTKDVDVNNEGYYSSGLYYDNAEENKRDVYEGGQYNYRLRMMSDTETISKDLILFDFLESFEMIESEDNDPIDFDAPRWKGYLRGVDVSQLKQAGCAPVVYYSTKEGMNLERANPDFEAIKNVENTEIWIKAEDYEGDLDDVKAIAIDARRRTDGSDFILDPEDSITAIIRMQAPSGEEAKEAISQKGKWGESAHAYNNAYLSAVSIDASTGEGHEEDVIRKDYTKVGLTEYKYEVEKVWDDSDNNDGIRPTSVTFVLYANDEATDKTVTVDESTNWKGAFEHIPYTDPEGNKIHYTAREERVEGYSASYQIIDPTHVKVTNRHEPEKITLSGEKTWVDESEDTRPESITVILKANDEEIKKLQVKPDKEGNWKYAFSDLLKYEKGKQIEYTIEEYVEKGKIASYRPEIDGYNIINIHHPYGDLYVDKDLINATDVSSETEFTFVFAFTKDGTPTFDEYDYDILDEDGEVLRSGKVSSADGSNKISIKASETIHVKEIDEYLEYTVTEENCEGFSLASTKGTTGQILPNKDASARFSNIYKANGQYSPVATKVLRNRELQKYQFSFELYGEDDKTLLKVATSDKPESTGTDEDGYYSVAYATFGAIRYTQEDAGKTFTYYIHERLASKAGYIYDETTYRLEVEVEDNGDGTLAITPTYYKGSEEVKDPLFTNTYKAEGSLELRAWKELKNGKLEEESFEFAVYDKEGEPIKDAEGTPLTARNDKEGNIVFNAIPYTEKDIGKEYTYVIKEIIPSEDSDEDPFIYDDGKIEYTVKVSDNGNGTLSTETLIRNYKLNEEGEYEQIGKDNEVPLFTNKLKPGKLTVSKYVINPEEADPQQEFRFKVKLIGEDVKDGKIEYELTAADEEANAIPTNESVNDEEEQNETNENSSLFSFRLPSLFKNVYAEEGDIATGKSGTCDWRIDANGVLRIFPSDGSSGKLASYTRGYDPWYEYREKITKIVVEPGVKTAAGCAYLFYYLGKCKEIDLHNLDTSEAVNMSYMLYGLGVKEMDLSSFDTTNVTNMQRIVMGCDN
ncbi:MAG: Cna B-type domain-containing protein, partial [Erysipelotrichaceae bacterium]|nr:Cna B-type domain-containing protein [Erysipelotrichaceae bacterium]